jgi:hypothetical protein
MKHARLRQKRDVNRLITKIAPPMRAAEANMGWHHSTKPHLMLMLVLDRVFQRRIDMHRQVERVQARALMSEA